MRQRHLTTDIFIMDAGLKIFPPILSHTRRVPTQPLGIGIAKLQRKLSDSAPWC